MSASGYTVIAIFLVVMVRSFTHLGDKLPEQSVSVGMAALIWGCGLDWSVLPNRCSHHCASTMKNSHLYGFSQRIFLYWGNAMNFNWCRLYRLKIMSLSAGSGQCTQSANGKWNSSNGVKGDHIGDKCGDKLFYLSQFGKSIWRRLPKCSSQHFYVDLLSNIWHKFWQIAFLSRCSVNDWHLTFAAILAARPHHWQSIWQVELSTVCRQCEWVANGCVK